MTSTKQIKVSSMPKPKKGYVPNIRMSGEWLRRAGFEIGSLVDIKIQPGQIVISIEQAEFVLK